MQGLALALKLTLRITVLKFVKFSDGEMTQKKPTGDETW